ncbi:MAG: sodium:solute symporter family transporter [Rubripirellula sp.]
MGETSNAALFTFVAYTISVFLLAMLSNRVAKGKEFVGEYFLGSRGFGVWAFALTFAATNASGGTFMGFPALIYTHGWTLALWIAAFMIMPLVSMALIGKRLNQVARQCDALTIPEVMRSRFESPAVGLVATSLLIFFMFFYLVAQFKAGGKILSTLFAGEPFFQSAVAVVDRVSSSLPWVSQAEPDYLVCLIVFSAAVIVYVVYGGFRAVVWTDVMQGIVMFGGVIVMLGLALWQVGGLENATRKMAKMIPPEHGTAILSSPSLNQDDRLYPKGTWVSDGQKVCRLAELAVIPSGRRETAAVKVLLIATPYEIEELQQQMSEGAIPNPELGISIQVRTPYQHGGGRAGSYISNPGPSRNSDLGFLAIGSAISFFIFWPFAATGQPSNMVRLLSFKDTRTLRFSILTVSIYYSVIYFSLVVIFCCARVLMPGMEIDPDRAMPDFASRLTADAGAPWLAGLLVAAPFAAVMSSVDSFLLVVSSAVVRDIYQQHVTRDAPERKIKTLSYAVTVVVGILAVLFALNPPDYLQDLIVFATGGLAACFLVPMVLCLYWRRMTSAATIAGMLGGTLTHLGLTLWGYLSNGEFRAYEFMGLNPFVWDLAGSLAAVLITIQWGPRPSLELQRKFFTTDKPLPSQTLE